jgi:hypothetical protein
MTLATSNNSSATRFCSVGGSAFKYLSKDLFIPFAKNGAAQSHAGVACNGLRTINQTAPMGAITGWLLIKVAVSPGQPLAKSFGY